MNSVMLNDENYKAMSEVAKLCGKGIDEVVNNTIAWYMEDLEDEADLAEAERRIANGDLEHCISMEEVMEELGITEADLDAIPDEEVDRELGITVENTDEKVAAA